MHRLWRGLPSREWWADGDPFVHDTSETIVAPRDPSNTGRVCEAGSTLTTMPVAHAVPEQATRLSGETLVNDRRSWQSYDSAVRGQVGMTGAKTTSNGNLFGSSGVGRR